MKNNSMTNCLWLLRAGLLAGVLGAGGWAGVAYARADHQEEMHQSENPQ
jgi:predicted DNA-binding transcriptional regulator